MKQAAAIFTLLAAAACASADAFRDGLLALERGDLAAAQSSLEEAKKAAPRDGRVLLALAQVYLRQNKSAEAATAAQRAAELGPDEPAVLRGLAIYYSETHESLKAARAQAKYAAKVPADKAGRERAAELYFEAANPLLQAQKFEAAAGVLEEAAAQAPESAQIQLALGVSDYGLRRFTAAADAFLRTIDLDPTVEQPYQFLGRILDQIPNRLKEATERFAAYEAAHPDRALGYLLHAKGLDAQSAKPETALRLLERSIAIDRTDPAAHFELGTVFDRLERYSEAAAAFARAADLAPSDAAVHYRLARDYDRIGKHEAAQAEREKHARLIQAQEVVR
jgi:tetratricopeptide (TPR) repeat protein